MAPRTISQIAGEFGLARGADADPFAQSEQATIDVVSRALQDVRSQQLEAESARGFGRSTFADAIAAQQQERALSQVGQTFAQARTQEALREREFERGVISQQLGADVQSRLLGEQTQAETQLIGARGAEQRTTLAQQLEGQQAQIQAQTEAEQQLIGARAEEQRAAIEAQAAATTGLEQVRAQEQRATLAEQRAGALEQIGAESGARLQQLEAAGVQERLTQAQTFDERSQLLAQESQLKEAQIQQNFLNESALLEQRFATMLENLPAELQAKAAYEKDLIESRLEIQREEQLTDLAIASAFNLVTSLLTSEGGGLDDLIDSLGGSLTNLVKV